mmetsp:Transcript_27394/g.50334  ORF Transcript_27394/g.50334 Transcript_27394/m.50334 type:complete len:257 (-) Transcript_27394:1517-2287(-)
MPAVQQRGQNVVVDLHRQPIDAGKGHHPRQHPVARHALPEHDKCGDAGIKRPVLEHMQSAGGCIGRHAPGLQRVGIQIVKANGQRPGGTVGGIVINLEPANGAVSVVKDTGIFSHDAEIGRGVPLALGQSAAASARFVSINPARHHHLVLKAFAGDLPALEAGNAFRKLHLFGAGIIGEFPGGLRRFRPINPGRQCGFVPKESAGQLCAGPCGQCLCKGNLFFRGRLRGRNGQRALRRIKQARLVGMIGHGSCSVL